MDLIYCTHAHIFITARPPVDPAAPLGGRMTPSLLGEGLDPHHHLLWCGIINFVLKINDILSSDEPPKGHLYRAGWARLLAIPPCGGRILASGLAGTLWPYGPPDSSPGGPGRITPALEGWGPAPLSPLLCRIVSFLKLKSIKFHHQTSLPMATWAERAGPPSPPALGLP